MKRLISHEVAASAYYAYTVSTEDSSGRGALSLLVDLDSRDVARMDEVTLASAGLKERRDLQRWITAHPDLIAPGLLLITTEFDRWEVRDHKVADRLDALFLDPSGAPVVVELKRDKATDTVELQALKYAAYCSQLTLDELAEEFAATRAISTDESREQLLDHAPALEEGGLRSVKILLVAGSFGPAVTSVVLWLRDYGIDIGCIEVSARAVPGANQAVITARQLLPLPEAEDYLVRRRRKEQEEERARQEPTEWSWESYAARFPAEQLTVARRLFDELTRYVQEHQLTWAPALRAWWLGFKRPGGYYVPIIILRRENPIEFAVKLPDSPERLDLDDPYPALKSWWDAPSRQWTWAIPALDEVPDVRLAVELSRRLQPDKGPMPAPPERASTHAATASDNGPQPPAAPNE
jgi:hypothetical protein